MTLLRRRRLPGARWRAAGPRPEDARRATPRRSRQRGQATVELAMLLPVVLMVLLVVVQVALLARDRLAVVHSTRAVARTVIVEPSAEAAARSLRAQGGAAASGRVSVSGSLRPGGLATVAVTMPATRAPIIGRVVQGVTLRERLTVYVEGPT